MLRPFLWIHGHLSYYGVLKSNKPSKQKRLIHFLSTFHRKGSTKSEQAFMHYGCFRIQKNCFWAFKKIIMDIHLTTTCMIISIFTLDGGFQLFWAAFDLPIRVVPLKVALGLEKNDFWEFKKNNHEGTLDIHFPDYQIRS